MSRNRFPGPCLRCGKSVLAGEGYTLGKPGAWQLTHERCIPVDTASPRETLRTEVTDRYTHTLRYLKD